MTLRRRAVLIAAGIIIFIALGPMIVLLAQGYRYDFKNGDLTVTGTLVVKTEPRGAQVFLNGQASNDTPLVKRFLTPNEYLVEITKPEYRPWRKRVNVFERQVSFLPDQNSKINLLLQENKVIKEFGGVADIFAYEDLLFYINPQGSQIFANSFNAVNSQLLASTTMKLASPRFVEARRLGPNAEFILNSEQGFWFVSDDTQIVLPNLTSMRFGAVAGTVLALNGKNQLVEVKASGTQILQNNALSYRRNNDQIYYLTKNPLGEHWLMRTRSGDDTPTAVIKTAPFQNSNIILSPDNQVYLLLDQELYAVKDILDKINSQIEFAYWDTHGGFLIYGNSHEAWIYQPLAGSPNQLLTRASVPTAVPLYHKSAGYIFVIQDKEIKAIEADQSGQPNVYSLFLGHDPKKISLNDEGNIMAILDGQTLRFLQIR